MRKGICKHCLGTRDRQCALGIDVRSLAGGPDFGWWLRRPCISVDYYGAPCKGTVPCDKYEDPTDKEIVDSEAQFAEMERRFLLTLPITERIRREHHGYDWEGIVACPVCSGNLLLRHAGVNGHIQGSCTTKDCLNWME